VIVRFVDIGGTDDLYGLNFLSIIVSIVAT
jgi:hypothetical protein